MSDAIIAYVKRVKELAEHVKGNEQATKQSLIGPLFTTLGYDLTDPRECLPEHRADFGPARSVKPIDWVFSLNGRPVFVVEAKEPSRKLAAYDEQLADYFHKLTECRLGILTNGVQWRFFTDIVNPNVMDKEPFIKWDVINDENPPFDFLTLLQKSQFNTQLIRTFAERKHHQNLLVNELNRLLEPSNEFVRLAITNIETRRMTDAVIDSWKPVLANAIEEWAKQRMLTLVLSTPRPGDPPQTAPQASRIETTKEELEGFEIIQGLLGPARPVAYEDTVSYFKIHLVERYTWVICRLYFDRKRPCVWVPLPSEQTLPLVPPALSVSTPQLGWSSVNLNTHRDVEQLGDLLCLAWEQQRQLHPVGPASNVTAPLGPVDETEDVAS
ncbi:MAG: type I restriction endonuclease [Isosphaeraceae bacterium]